MLDETPDVELDTGPRKTARGAERLCAVTRVVKPEAEMIRFVVGPDGIVPDLKRKLPGRGVWVTATRDALAEAVKRNVFARGFKREVRVTADLADFTEQLLVRAALDALAITGKAGGVVTGFSKVESALVRDGVVALFHAAEAARDGVKKLNRILGVRDDAPEIRVITRFSTAQLDLALGRSNVVHAAALAGSATSTFMARFQRLERFRTGDSAAKAAIPAH